MGTSVIADAATHVMASRSTIELVGIDATAVVAVLTAITLLSKFKPIRWVMGRLFSVFKEPVVELVERPTRELGDQVIPLINDLSTALEEHRQYTFYHLGPNGTSPPLVSRITRLEELSANSTK